MPGPSRNYAKELERLIQKLQQEGKVPRLLLHAAARPAPAPCWSTFPSILPLRCCIITPISPPWRSTKSGKRSCAAWSPK